MPLVRVKRKHQVTIPAKVRDELKLEEGDLLEVQVQGNCIVLTPQVVVERVDVRAAVQEGLEAYHQGDVSPSFDNLEDLEAYLEKA